MENIVKAVNVGIWMGRLSESAYEHETSEAFKKCVKEHISRHLGKLKPIRDMQDLLMGGFEEHIDEQRLREAVNEVLSAAQQVGHPKVVVDAGAGISAAACYPNPTDESGGWIKVRAYPLSLDLGGGFHVWDCREVVECYVPSDGQSISSREKDDLAALRLHAFVIWAHAHALT